MTSIARCIGATYSSWRGRAWLAESNTGARKNPWSRSGKGGREGGGQHDNLTMRRGTRARLGYNLTFQRTRGRVQEIGK